MGTMFNIRIEAGVALGVGSFGAVVKAREAGAGPQPTLAIKMTLPGTLKTQVCVFQATHFCTTQGMR